jgi:hypothetical protein
MLRAPISFERRMSLNKYFKNVGALPEAAGKSFADGGLSSR